MAAESSRDASTARGTGEGGSAPAQASASAPVRVPADLSTVKVPEAVAPVFRAAENYVREYFAQTVQDPARSLIEISGERYVLVRAASLSVEFFDLVRSLYKDAPEGESARVANNLLFDLAHAIGKADARSFHARMGVTDPVEKLSAGPIHFSFSGWAFVNIHPESRPSADENFFLLYDHPYSFEADAWMRRQRAAEGPVCIMNAGYSSGWCEESFGIPLVAVELECVAARGAHCRFVMAPPHQIEGYVEKLRHSNPAVVRHASPPAVPEFFHRKRLEQALRDSEAQFRMLVETIPQQVWQSDASGEVIYVNQEWQRFRGLTAEQSRGPGWHSTIHPGDLERVESGWRQAVESGTPFELTYRVREQSSGEFRWVLGRALPLRDQSGRIASWYGTNTDIDRQKRAEDALRISEARFRLMVEQNPLSIQIFSPDGETVAVNPAWERLWGVTLQTLGGYNILHDAQLLERGVMPQIRRAFDEGVAVAIPPIAYNPEVGEFKDEPRYVRAFLYPILEAGKVREVILCHEDVTDQLRAEDKLRRTEKLAAAGRLAATVAHEINNPLAGVTNLVYLIRQTNSLQAAQQYAERAEEELLRVAHIAKQTLAFYRDTRERRVVDVNRAAEFVVQMYHARLAQAEVGVRQDFGPGATIFAAEGEVQQILSNLLVNAMDASRPGSQLILRTRTAGPRCAITLLDRGCGIPEANRKRIFEPFYTTKADVGTGLGLWITKELVEKNGGRIRIRSSIAAGRSYSIFRVSFPRVTEEESAYGASR